jgi:tetratricopeptide (TPR) repeat protein
VPPSAEPASFRDSRHAALHLVHAHQESVGALVAKLVFTLGIYDLFWLRKRARAIDALAGKELLGRVPLNVYTGMVVGMFCLPTASTLLNEPTLATWSSPLALGVFLQRARFALAIRRGLREQVPSGAFKMNWFLTALFPALYPQIAINSLKIVKAKPPAQPPVRLAPNPARRGTPWRVALAGWAILCVSSGAMAFAFGDRTVAQVNFGGPAADMPADDAGRLAACAKLIDDYQGDPSGLRTAQGVLEDMARREPKNALAHALLGRCYYKLGFRHSDEVDPRALKAAHEVLDRAIAIDPPLPEGHLYKAWAHFYDRADDAGRREAKEALRLKPGWLDAILIEAEIDLRAQRAPAPIAKGLEKALAAAKTPRDRERALGTLEDAYWYLEDWEGVERCHKGMIAIDPKSAWHHSNYAGFLNRRERYDEAIAEAKAALALMEFGMAHRNLGKAYAGKAYETYWTQRNYEEGIRLYELSLKEFPEGDSALFYTLGQHHLKVAYDTQNKDLLLQAEKELSQAIAMRPDFPDAKERLVYIAKLKQHLGM